MKIANPLLSPMESIQEAWGLKLRGFRQWCTPAGQVAITNWKTRQLEDAIIVAKSTMMDDAEAMLRAVTANDNARSAGRTDNSGTSVSLPFMVTAISAVEVPPEEDVVKSHPQWRNIVVPADPLQRVVQGRAMSAAYRCQIAFFSADPHSASSISKQFVAFWKHEGKRSFNVSYELGFAGTFVIKEDWNFKVAENTLYPDKLNIEAQNIYGVTVDCVIVGLEPNVVGLGGYGDDITDKGEPEGSVPPDLPPLDGSRDDNTATEINSVVTEADVLDPGLSRHTRVAINPETMVVTETNIKDSAL